MNSAITIPANIFNGTVGNDTLVGGIQGGSIINGLGGNDSLQGQGGGNVISGGTGDDILFAGDGGGNVLAGDAGHDTLIGGNGNDMLAGGAGNDSLTGGAGADVFIFTNPAHGVDTVSDFNVLEDRMRISVSGFGLTVPPELQGQLATNQLLLPAEQFRLGSSAITSSDRFIYNSTSGVLFFDADGVGAAAQTQIAQLSAGLALTHQNFLLAS